MPLLCMRPCFNSQFFPLWLLIRLNMYYAIAPFDFQTEQLVVDVETEGTITTGTMVPEVYVMPQ
jgi:hypothetical protein